MACPLRSPGCPLCPTGRLDLLLSRVPPLLDQQGKGRAGSQNPGLLPRRRQRVSYLFSQVRLVSHHILI